MHGPSEAGEFKMAYEIELEDHGQDLLRLTVDEKTGAITDAGPFHTALYASGDCIVNLNEIKSGNRYVHVSRKGAEFTSLKWPMGKLSLNGKTIAEMPSHATA
jgi:hypothetical protein